MQALILGDDHRQLARLAAAMMKTGFQVFCVESAAAAASYVRNELIDVLLLTETRSGRISQSCSCVAQSRNRAVSVIVLSNRTGSAMEELFEEVPMLYGVMGLEMAPNMVAALALASILPQQTGAELPQPMSAMPVAAPVQTAIPVQAAISVQSAVPVQSATPLAKPPLKPGHGVPLVRTLIEPVRRTALPTPAPALTPTPAPIPQPTLAMATNPTTPTRPTPGPQPRTVPDSPRWTGTTLSDILDIGPDLAALERELALVNRDRPSVLASSITEDLPRWSLSAPKLAALTDWALATAASADAGGAGHRAQTPAVTKVRPDRRLEPGVTLQ